MGRASQLADFISAEGRRNVLINGNFDIWQRGTSSTTGGFDSVDRFRMGGPNSKQWDATVGNYVTVTSSGQTVIGQPVELLAAGKSQFKVGDTYTLSVRFRTTATIYPFVAYRDGLLGANQVGVYDGDGGTSTAVGTGNWQEAQWTFSITNNPVATNTCLAVFFLATVAGQVIDIANMQLEKGGVATPFEERSYAEELALCQRYYWRYIADGGLYTRWGFGTANTTTSAAIMVKNPVPMRTPDPTVSYSALATSIYLSSSAVGHVPTSIAVDGNGSSREQVNLAVNASGLTQFRPYFIEARNTSAWIAFDTEL